MRAIDADNLKQQYGMKDDCSDCEKETKGKVKSCEYDREYTLMDFCRWIDDMPTIETQQTCEYWDSESKFCALCRPSAQPESIHCRECKHWKQQTNYAGAPLSFGFCESDDMWRSLYGETYEVSHIDTDDDFYCGFAERRTNESD